MKKYFYSMLLMAVALMTASVFVSCGDDDDDPVAPKPIVKNYAIYEGKMSEDIFQYYDVTVSIEYDGQTMTYKYSEDTKMATVDFDIPGWTAASKRSGRVLKVPAFEFGAHPVKCSHKFELTEAGKAKIASNPDAEIDFAYNIIFDESDEKGNLSYNYSIDKRGFNGQALKGLEALIATLSTNSTFTKTLK